MDSDITTSASCRIVVVSPTLETAKDIASRIKTLAGDDSPADDTLGVINWTIKNKYYTAPVHFQPIHVEGLELLELDDVPAVIYAWGAKEPYKDHLELLMEELDSLSAKPEVALAVNIGISAEGVEEEFFMAKGFEYIDGHRDVSQQRSADFDLAPGLDRAVDALSTIMWPSMTRMIASNKRHLKLPFSHTPEEEDTLKERGEMGEMLASADGRIARQREMEKLERWLEAGSDDEDDEDMYALEQRGKWFDSTKLSNAEDPWATGSPRPDASQTASVGFEDDFSEFVSGPPKSTPTEGREKDEATSDSDLDMPNETEIQAAKARIFGHSRSLDTSSQLSAQNPSDPSFSETGRSVQSELNIDMPAFDLSRILSALDGMRAEVALISDEKERRKTAAELALGLVYGLNEMRALDDEDENGEELIEEIVEAPATTK